MPELENYSLFDAPPFKVQNDIRIIELFGGIGAQVTALKRLGVPFSHYRLVEFDRFACASYNAMHGTDFKPTDIKDTHAADLGIEGINKHTYLLTYSFPCTDLSIAGAMQGMDEGSGTRSALLWEVKRLLEECLEYNGNLPQILQMENVPQIHSKANMPNFQKWISFLDSIGYRTYWQDMNAKDYGVAQSRNRTIAISILGDYSYEFPQPFPLRRVMLDYLEDEVDEKYYLYSEKARQLILKLLAAGQIPLPRERERWTVDFDLCRPERRDIANCIQARYDKGISLTHQDGTGVIECLKIE